MRNKMRCGRIAKGLTVKDVAQKIGVHENAVLRWENGTAEPLGSNLIKLSKLYGISADELMDQETARDI